jgi:uncharacterized protein YjdB
MKNKQLLTMLLLLISSVSFAVDREVSPGQSIQAAIDAASSGDRIVIHTGTYSQNVSIINRTNLTITFANDGEVIIQGDGTTQNTFWIQNSSSITISNLTIKNTRKLVWSTGITIIGAGNNFQILNNKLTDISYRSGAYDSTDNPDEHNAHFEGVNAISVVGDNATTAISNVVIQNNEVSYCMTGWSESIALKGNVDGFIVDKNKVHHITNIGIDAFGLGDFPAITSNNQARNGSITNNEVYNCICNYTDNGAIYIDGGLNIKVMNNKVYNNKYGITIGCENQMQKPDGATEFIEVRNNLVYNNALAGIMIGTAGDDDGVQGITRNSKVTGNTFVKNATGNPWASEFVLQNANNIEFYNNLFHSLYGRMGTIANGAVSNTFGYNVFFGGTGVTIDFSKQVPGDWDSQTLAQFKADQNDNSSTSQDPKLVNANVASLDAHLQSTSPCINTGKPSFATIAGEKDLDGHGRISGSAVDIGVDEYGSSTTVAVTGVSVSPTSASIAVGATQQLTKTIAPSNATNQNVTWTSNNTSVATVNSSGLVTAVAAGSATITATTQDGGFTATSAITVTSGGSSTITIDGSLSDWSGISAIATATGQSSLSLKVYDDATYLYFGVSGSGFGQNYQVYINSDNNTSTGYQHSSFTTSGAEYHIENGTLRSYTGTGTNWSWSNVGTATASKNGSVTEVRVAKSLLSLGTTVTVAFADINSGWTLVSKLGFATYTQLSSSVNITVNGNLSDWSSVTAIATASGQTSTSLKVHANASTLYFGVAGSGMSATDYQIFINADNNTTTGYQDAGYTSSGADYMIENGNFYKSTASNTGWNWTPATATLTFSKTSSVTELSVNRSAFSSPALSTTIKVAYKDMVNWATVSKLPSSGTYATYTLPGGSGGARHGEAIEIVNETSGDDNSFSVYPNPNNGSSVVVNFVVPHRSDVNLSIKDIHGREAVVKRLGIKERGSYSERIDTSSLSNGMYILNVMVGQKVKSIKLLRN